MSERSTEIVPPRLLAALREQRADCPPLELLLEPERAEAADRERIERHVELCPICAGIVEPASDEIDDLTWRGVERELDARGRPWAARAGVSDARERPPILLAIAAAALVLLGGLAVWRLLSDSPPPPASSGVLRGAPIQPLEPAGEVGSVDVFRWRIVAPLEAELHVEVERGEAPLWTPLWKPLWSEAASGGSLEAPPSLRDQLGAGAYRWRVTALDSAGAVVARSSWIEFQIE